MRTPTSTKTRGKRGGSAATAQSAAPTPAPARSSRGKRSSNPNGGMPAQAEATATTIATPASKARIATLKRMIATAEKIGDTFAKQQAQNTSLLDMLKSEQKLLLETA